MKTTRKRDSLLAMYILTALVLAAIYFTVPERKEFIDFQLTWWGELWQVMTGGS